MYHIVQHALNWWIFKGKEPIFSGFGGIETALLVAQQNDILLSDIDININKWEVA